MKADRIEWDPRTAWRRYCGFLDISLDTFMEIQYHLLMEQVELISDCPLGRTLMAQGAPRTVQQFRDTVPLTSYEDYRSFLDPAEPHGLPEGEYAWAYTSGAADEQRWVPYTRRGYNRFLDNVMAAFLLAGAQQSGDVSIRPGDVVMYNLPARPYLSGMASFGMVERFGVNPVIDPAAAENMEFNEKVRASFSAALNSRVDVIISLTSVITRVAEAFEEQQRQDGNQNGNGDNSLLGGVSFRGLGRLAKAKLATLLARRPMRPKDLWPTKALVGWGMDTQHYRHKLREYWGRDPLEMYAATEGGVMGMQSWRRRGMVFTPYAAFYEFIPEDEIQATQDEGAEPKTVLLPEVQPGKAYELVISNFYGMPLLRYRVGHLIRFRETPAEGWPDGPEFDFIGRSDGRIDILGFTRIDERTILDAVHSSGIAIGNWVARRENDGEQPVLHIYAERAGELTESEATDRLDAALRENDPPYRDLEAILNTRPLRVTLLEAGVFNRYYESQASRGAALDQRQPTRMNPEDETVGSLLRLSAEARE
ncbi:MAG: GH3 family domain-containing protein [Chloroflexota bacterium]